MDINAAGSSAAGASEEKISALSKFASSEHYTPAEQVALELAETMTWNPQGIDADLYNRLREHFDEAQLVELAAMAAYENMRSRFNRVFDIESNDLYHPTVQSAAT